MVNIEVRTRGDEPTVIATYEGATESRAWHVLCQCVLGDIIDPGADLADAIDDALDELRARNQAAYVVRF